MIITELFRGQCYEFGLYDNNLPQDVVKKLQEYDLQLTLLYNKDDEQWEFYRIKQKGVTSSLDLLHWQISYLEKGTYLPINVIEWLKKYDTSYLGSKSQDEMKSLWLKQFKNAVYKQKQENYKRYEEISYNAKPEVEKMEAGRIQISVPITVGFNKRTGKKILAVRK